MSLYRGMMGQYQPRRQFDVPDVIIVNSFGTVTDAWGVNAKIKAFAIRQAFLHHVPVFMDEVIDETYGSLPKRFKVVIGGAISTVTGGGLGTWGVLKRSKDLMDGQRLHSPLLVSHANHIERTVRQAMNPAIRMNPIVLEDLPGGFDVRSRQIWTKALPLWVAHEVIGAPLLKKRGQL